MTIQDILMEICWQDGLENELTTKKEIVDYAMPKLFDFNYLLYDEKLKEEFQRQFINHFYMREIGSESRALFKVRLEDYLTLSYPKWQKLYNTFEEINPFLNYDVKTERAVDENENTDKKATRDDVEGTKRTVDTKENMKSNQKTTSNTNSVDFNREIDTDTPDDRMKITVNDGTGALDYASNITENRGKNTTDATGNTDVSRETTGNEKSDTNRLLDRDETEKRLRELNQVLDERKYGKIGNLTYTSMYEEFISTFEGINKQMFKEMGYLFMGLLN